LLSECCAARGEDEEGENHGVLLGGVAPIVSLFLGAVEGGGAVVGGEATACGCSMNSCDDPW
jgi:hypothetical protein